MTARIRYHIISCQRFVLIDFNVAVGKSKTDCPISLFSAASILARVKISDTSRHKLADQSQAPSETAAILSIFFVRWSTKIANCLYRSVIRKYNNYIEQLLDSECILMQ